MWVAVLFNDFVSIKRPQVFFYQLKNAGEKKTCKGHMCGSEYET